MEIQKIKIELENIGYFTNLYSNYDLLVVGTKMETGNDGIDSIQNSFGIEVKEDLIVIEYTVGQISKEQSFSSIKDSIEFIKNLFPIEDR